MTFIIISCRVIITDAIKPILKCMITYFLIAQIIADGVRIAEDIYILIAPKIHRHVGLLQLSEQLRVTDAGKHIDQQIPSVHMVFGKLRKLHVLLLLKQEHLTKKL